MINKYALYKLIVERCRIPEFRTNLIYDDQIHGGWIPMTNKNGDIHMVYCSKDEVFGLKFWMKYCHPYLIRHKAKKDPAKVVNRCCDYIFRELRNGYFESSHLLYEAKEAAEKSGNDHLITKVSELEALIDKVGALSKIKPNERILTVESDDACYELRIVRKEGSY